MLKVYLESGEYQLLTRQCRTQKEAEAKADEITREFSRKLNMPYREVYQHIRIVPEIGQEAGHE